MVNSKSCNLNNLESLATKLSRIWGKYTLIHKNLENNLDLILGIYIDTVVKVDCLEAYVL